MLNAACLSSISTTQKKETLSGTKIAPEHGWLEDEEAGAMLAMLVSGRVSVRIFRRTKSVRTSARHFW